MIKRLIKLKIVLVLIVTSVTSTLADTLPVFETELIDYDYVANDYFGIGDEVIPNGSTLEPGQNFQVNMLLEDAGSFEMNVLILRLKYDSSLVEPLYYLDDDSDPANLLYEPIEPKDSPILPRPDRGQFPWVRDVGLGLNETINTSFSVNNEIHAIKQGPDKILLSAYFKVKDDAPPGSEIRFTYSDESNVNILGNVNYKLNSDGLVGETAYATVAGATVDENNALSDITIEGSTDEATYDYLEDFEEDTTSYDLVVPPSVDTLTFSHELEDITSGTVVKHGKLSGPGGTSVSGFNLDVGDNYFTTAVSSSDGASVKAYHYTVKRLSNSTDFDLTGLDDKGSVVTFDSNNETIVRSDADTVEMSLSMGDGSEPEFQFSSSDAIIDGNKIAINKDKTDTPFIVAFKPEDALEKYDDVLGINDDRSLEQEFNFKFVRASDDNSLKEIKVINKNTGDEIHQWTESQDTYTLEVPNDLDKIALVIETNHADAQIMTSGLDEIHLNPGDNTIPVAVNAPDGTKKTYIFEIKRVPRATAELSSLSVKVDGVEKNTPITSVNHTTNIVLDYKESYTLDIEGIANGAEGASLISGNVRDETIGVGTHQYSLKVEAEDKTTTQEYIVNITVQENTDSKIEGDLEVNPDLDDEILDDGIIDESIEGEKDEDNQNIDIYRYQLKVKNSKKSFSMDDLNMTIPENATLTGGLPIDLSVGENTFTFDITSQDGNSISRYIITIHRAKNDVAAIETLEVTSDPQGTLTGNFEDGFTYKVSSNVLEYTVSASTDDGSVVDPSTVGTFALNESKKVHIVTVTSEDETDTKDIPITIERAESSDATLSEFVVSYGDVQNNDIIGSFVNQSFTLNVAKDVDTIDIFAKTTHPKATFTINQTSDTNFNLDYGRNTFDIEVRSETGGFASYTFVVNREKSDNADLNALRIDGKLVPGFNKDRTDYTLDAVDEDTTNLDITYTTADPNATVSVSGNDLKYGQNTITVAVTAQDGTTKKIYHIEVERELSSSADLGEDGILPEDGNHNIESDPTDPYRYTVYVPYGTKTYGSSDFKLDIDPNATVSYEKDPIDLDETKEFKFEVQSPNGKNTQAYIIEVVIMDSGVPLLKGIAIDGVSVDAFNADVYEQVIELNHYLDEKANQFEFTTEAKDGVDVDFFSPMINVTGQSVIEQKVTLTSLSTGMTNTYTFKFTRSLTNDPTLGDLEVSEGVMMPSFEENPEGPFVVDVEADTESIEIDASLNNPNSSVSGDGSVDLVPGENKVTITVTPENGPDKDYEIIINRPLGLDVLKLGDVEVDVSSGILVEDTLTYTLHDPIDADVLEAYLHVVPNHESVMIQGSANEDITLNNEDIQFVLVAQDGKTRLNVVVKYTRLLSDEVRLRELESLVDDFIIKDFDSDTFEYQIEVEHDFMTLKREHLSWKPMHPNTQVTAVEQVELSNTEETIYEIHTESESGNTGKYSLRFTRGTFNLLDNLTIGDQRGHLEEEFKPDQFEYHALVYSGVERFSFEWEVQAGVSVKNASSLKNISTEHLPNTFTIEVEGDNGETNEYTVHVDHGVSTRLANLDTSEGTIDFSPNVYEYDVYVAEDSETVSLIDVIPEDKDATLSGNYENVPLNNQTTSVSVKVSNHGYDSTYTVNFIKTKDLTDIKSVLAYLENDIWHANKKEDGSFELIVDYGVDLDALEYSIELEDQSGSYVMGDVEIKEDGYDYLISVTDKYGITKDHKLVVKNDLSDNNYLQSLTVNNALVSGFNRYATEYTHHTYFTNDLKIEAVAEDENANVVISDFVDDGNGGYISITVTSHKGSPNVYRLHFEKENIATLENLALKETGISPQFDKDIDTYFATVPYELDAVTVDYSFSHSGSVQINGQESNVVKLNEGKNKIEVSVTAEDDTRFVYIIEVTRTKKANNYLESLEVSSEDKTFALSPTFDPNILVYQVKIPQGLETVTVEADFEAGLNVEGLGAVTIEGSLTTHQVKVTEHGVTRVYTINIIQEASSDASLKELTTNKGELIQVENTFELKVGDEKDVSLEAIANHDQASVKGDGTIDLVAGKNIVTVIITAEDGITSEEYKVVIIRDVILESVRINEKDYTVTLDEDESGTIYRIDDSIDSQITKSKVYPTFNDESVTHSGLEQEINFGSSGSFSFEAITRDGEKHDLVVKYKRTQSSDASLGKLVVNNREIELVEGQFEYEIEVPFNFDVFIKDNHLEAIPSHPNASFTSASELEIIPNENNPYVITVKAEDGTTQAYVLNIKRADYDAGPSTLLESLEVDQGQLDFISQNMVYNLKVAAHVDTVILSEIIPVDENAEVSSSYKIENNRMEVALDNDITTVKITVTNGGTVTVYSVTFEKVQDQTDIKDITVNDGENIWKGSLNEDTGKYEVMVDSDTNIEDLEVDVNLEFPGSSADIKGPFKDADGNDAYTVTVRDQNGIEKDYDLVVKKDQSSNAYLETLKVFDSTLIGFNKHTNDYTYTIQEHEVITADDIIAIPEDQESNVDVMVEEDVIKILVVAANGKENVYTITIEVEKEKETILESLRLLETGISPKFNKNEAKYYGSVPYEMDAVTVMYTSVSNASVEISATSPVDLDTNVVSNLEVGTNEINIKVSNGGVSYTYTIYVERSDKSETNFLDSLKVVDAEDESITYEFSSSFDKDTLVYSVEVPFDVNSFKIEGEFEAGLMVSGLDMLIIDDFPHIHKVKVADEAGIVREYAITFIKAYSNTSYLGNLSVSEGNLDPYFKRETTSYNVDVGHEIDTIDIDYELGAEDQLVTGAGTHKLEIGRNTFEITVRSGNASTVYTVNVHRENALPKLSDLSVSEGVLSPVFDEDKYVYHVSVEKDIHEIDIRAESEYTVVGDGLKTLVDGDNIFEIEVTNGTQTSYTYVIVYKASEDGGTDDTFYEENLDLAYLDLIGDSLNETFESHRLEYTADLTKPYYEVLEVVAVARNPKATVSITGHENLDNGTHIIDVTVSLPNGKSQTTTLTVTIDQHILESDVHEIGEKYIATILEKQTVLEVKNQMTNDNAHLKIFKDGEELSDESLVGTGAIIKLIVNEKEYDSKTLIVLGDVNGDGEVSIPDRMQAQSYVLGDDLTEAQMIAADVTRDHTVEINDVMLIQAHILELQNIFEMEEN